MTPSRLRENIIALTTLQAFNYLAPLITVPYLLRVLGPAHYGLLAFAQALMVYFDALTGYGFGLGATRAVTACRGRLPELAKAFWSTLYTELVLLLGSAGILAIMVSIIPQLHAIGLLLTAAFLTVVGTAVLPLWFFQGLEQMWPITFAQAGARTLSIPVLLFLVRKPDDYLRAAVIQGAVPLVAAVIAAPLVWARLRTPPPRPCFTAVTQSLRTNWHPFLTQAGLAFSASSTTVVLGLVAGPVAVGYYSAADKVIRAVSSLLGPVARALYPHLTSLRGQSLAETWRVMKKTFTWIAALALAASAVTFLLAGPVAPLVWGPGFDASVNVLRWLSPLPFVFALINVFGTQTMFVFEMDQAVSRVVLGGAGVNLMLAAVLSWRFAAVGAAAATVGSGSLIALFLALNVRSIYAVRGMCAPQVYAP